MTRKRNRRRSLPAALLAALLPTFVAPVFVQADQGVTSSALSSNAITSRTLFQRAKVPNFVFVTDVFSGEAYIANYGSWSLVGNLSNWLDGPLGIWDDAKGNLYVANRYGDQTLEFAPGSSRPKYSYPTGSASWNPYWVTTDSEGNVYVAVLDLSSNGAWINEYAQGSQKIRATFPLGGQSAGIAVDTKGDLFSTYWGCGNQQCGLIEEFRKGSSNPKLLPIQLYQPGGIAIDKDDNLVVANFTSVYPYVVQIAPPYRHFKRIYKGFKWPASVAFGPNDKELLVTDRLAGTVVVLSYPSGAPVTRFSDGWTYPAGIAVGPGAH